MNHEHIKAWAQVIAAIAWPLVVLILVMMFRKELSALASRLKRGKVLGQEIELDALNATAKAVDASIPIPSPKTVAVLASADSHPTQEASGSPSSNDEERVREIERRVLDEAARSPKVALMILSSEIEREVRRHFAMRGQLEKRATYPLSKAIDSLYEQSNLPPLASTAIEQFGHVRNRIVHGVAASEEEAIRAIDSGLVIIRSIARIPTAHHRVHKVNVPIFADPQCSKPMNGKAIILESIGHGAQAGSYQIFPTMRTHFQEGMEVTWEWDFNQQWQEAWYRDPESGKIKYAWSSSVEFAGRDINTI